MQVLAGRVVGFVEKRLVQLLTGRRVELEDSQPAVKDATLSIGLTAFFDTVDINRFDGSEEGSDDRTSYTLTTNW